MIKKMFVGLVIALFIAQGLGLAAADKTEKPLSKEVSKLFDKAEKALKGKKYDEAVELFNKAIELEPTYAPSYLGLALVQRDQKKYAESIENLEKMFKIKPDAPVAAQAYREILYAAGFEEYQKQDFKKSNEYFGKYLGIAGIENLAKKPVENVLYQVGLNSYFLKEFDKSLEYFTKYVNIPGIDTSSAQWFQMANYMLGLDYTQLNQQEKANASLQKFIDLNKDPANQQLPIAYYLIGSNNYTGLDAKVKKMGTDMIDGLNKEGAAINADTKMKPKEREAAVTKHEQRKTQVMADLKKQQVQMAADSKDIVPNLQKAIELRPDIEDAYVKLGNYYYLAGDLESGLKTYTTIKEKFPASPDAAIYANFIQKLEKEIAEKK